MSQRTSKRNQLISVLRSTSFLSAECLKVTFFETADVNVFQHANKLSAAARAK